MNAGYETERRTPSRLLSHHLVTAGVFFAFLSGAPVILCLALIIHGGDAGGPLFLPIFILGVLVFAGLITLLLGGVALLADVIQRRRGRSSPWWPAVVVFLLGAMMGGMVGGLTHAVVPVATGAAAVVGYGIYLLAVSLVSRLLGKWASGVRMP